MAEQTVILRLPELCKRVGLCRSSVYALVRSGQFPRPIPLTARAVGWRDAEVEGWLQSRAAQPGGCQMTARAQKKPRRGGAGYPWGQIARGVALALCQRLPWLAIGICWGLVVGLEVRL